MNSFRKLNQSTAMFYLTVTLWGAWWVPLPFPFTSCSIRKAFLTVYQSGTGKTQPLGVRYVQFFMAQQALIYNLNLDPHSFWKEFCSCDHWRCNQENVDHIFRTYFNHFQEENTSCLPHFSINSRGNGVNKINDLVTTRNELALLVSLLIKLMSQAIGRGILGKKYMVQKFQKWYANVRLMLMNLTNHISSHRQLLL